MLAYGLRRLTLHLSLLMVTVIAPASAQTVTVSPTSVSVPVGGDRQLSAFVNGVASTAVIWTVNGVVGGNATVGYISATGKYTAPAVPPAGWNVTARATSVSNSRSSATCLITVRNQIPLPTTLSPNPILLGQFKLTVGGSRFVSGAQVLSNGVPLATTFNSSTRLIATGNATRAGSININVANPGPGAVSAPLVLTVMANPTFTPTTVRRTTPQVTATPTRTSTMARTATVSLTSTPTMGRTEPVFTPTMVRTATVGVTSTPTMSRTEPVSTPTVVRTATVGMTSTPTMGRTEPVSTPTVVRTATVNMMSTPTMGRTEAASTPTVVRTPTSGVASTPTTVPITSPTIPDPLALTRLRFLDQATFGPTQQLTAHLAQIGIPAFIDEQFATPESTWPPLSTAQRSDAVDAFFGNALAGQDQLRQRVIFALSEIIVEAMNKNTNGDEIVPWLQLLSRNAFGNYRTLLKEITLDASMGKYLDLANSGLMGGAANENFPREVMQLFSIGLYQLNLDGSVQVDAQNRPLLTYSQTDVQQLAKALTGWTYGNATGIPPAYGNYNYYPGPMLPVASMHNTSAKTILGQTLPANQTIQQDLDGAINIIFNHPNVGPFLATRLIRALITSNPSPAYIARIATVFNDNGAGVRGDMQAVIRAILLDPEARNDSPPANFGRLRTPMQHTIALARALGLDVGAASQFAYLFYGMNEGLLDAASVFGHYSPTYRIPRTGLYGPEFQIFSASDAINRGNFFYSLMYNPWPINPALQPFVAVAGDPAALVNAVDGALLFGRMSPSTRTALLNALPAMLDNNARVLTALYLTSMSGECLVQR